MDQNLCNLDLKLINKLSRYYTIRQTISCIWNLSHPFLPTVEILCIREHCRLQLCFFQYSFCDFSLLPYLKFHFFCIVRRIVQQITVFGMNSKCFGFNVASGMQCDILINCAIQIPLLN